jgi:hypothetical protein
MYYSTLEIQLKEKEIMALCVVTPICQHEHHTISSSASNAILPSSTNTCARTWQHAMTFVTCELTGAT